MKKNILLYSKDAADMRLRSIVQNDIEELRVWKNLNRGSFFYKQEISPEAQAEWYQKYLFRKEDYIFIVEININDKWEKIGCLGFRVIEETIDLYNIIRGRKTDVRSSMKAAMSVLLAYLSKEYSYPVKCDVLVDNPAVEWYNKCGFSVKERKSDYYIMVFEKGVAVLPCINEEEE